MGNRNLIVEIAVKIKSGTKALLQNSLSNIHGLYVAVTGKLNKSETKKDLKKDLGSMGALKADVVGRLNKKESNKIISEDAKKLKNITVKATLRFNKKATQQQLDNDMRDITVTHKTGITAVKSPTHTSSPQINTSFMGGLRDRLGVVFGVDGIIRRFGQLVGDTVNRLKSVDTILTEISKTANLTKMEMAGLADTAFDSANKFGKSVESYLHGVNAFAQAGKKDVAGLAELSLMAQSAGNMESTLADEYLLATDAAYAYGGSIEKLTKVLDGQNQVTNRNAVSLSTIAEATKITGSQAAQSGIEINEMTAAISTMGTVTQMSGSELGRSLKGIIMNLSRVKGEIADGEIIDSESLSKSEKALSSVGIKLKEMKNGVLSLRNPMEVIKELSAAFMSLDESDVRRSNIVEAIGGKYRANQLTALLSNYDMYEKILADYADSEDSAMRESQKTADSWEGRLNQLNNSWLEFASGFTNTNWIKGSVSGLNSMVQTLDELNQAGMFIPSLAASVTALQTTLQKNYGITQIKNQATGKLDIQGNIFGVDFTAIAQQKRHFADAEKAIFDWNTEVNRGRSSIDDFKNATAKNNEALKTYLDTSKTGNASLSGYKASLNAAGISTDALRLKTIALNAVIGLGIGLAIQGVISAVQALAEAHVTLAEQQEKVSVAAENYKKVKSDIVAINDELATTNKQMDALNAKDALSLTEQDELSKLKETNTELAIRLALMEKEEEIAAKKLGDESEALYNKQFKNADFSEGTVNEYQSVAKATGNNLGLVADKNDIAAMVAGYKQAAEHRKEATNPEDAQIFSNIMNDIEGELLGSVTSLQDIKTNLSALKSPSQEQLDIIHNVEAGIDLINSQLIPDKWKKIKFDEIFNSDEMAGVKAELSAMSKAGTLNAKMIESYSTFSTQLSAAKISAGEAVNEINALNLTMNGAATATNFVEIIDSTTESFKSLATEVDNIQAAYKTLSSAIEEYSEKGYLSLDTMQSIMALGDDYIGFLFDENGQLQLNKEGFIALANAKLDELEATALGNAITNVQALTDEAIATEYLTDKTNADTTATDANTEAKLKLLVAENLAKGGNISLATKQIADTFAQYKTIIDATRSSLGNYTDETMGAASATDKLNAKLKAEGDAGVRVIDKQIKAIQDKQKASEKIIDANIAKIKEEKKAYEDAINAEIDALEDRKKVLEDDLGKYDDAASVAIDIIDKQMEALNKQKDETSKFYDDQIDALDKTNKALQDKIDLENALEAIAKAKSAKVYMLKNGKFDYYDDDGAIKEATDAYDKLKAEQDLASQKEQIAAERDEKLKALQDEIDRYQKYQDLWKESTTAYQREKELQHALEIFDVGFEQAISDQRVDILEKFAKEHYDKTTELQENVLTQIEILQKQKDDELLIFEESLAQLEADKAAEAANYAARIETLNNYKTQVQEQLALIGTTWADYQAQLDAEAKWETVLYGDMAGVVEDYADRVEEAMRRAQEAKANADIPSHNSDNANEKKWVVKDKDTGKTVEVCDTGSDAASYRNSPDYSVEYTNKYKNGTLKSKEGYANLDEDGAELKIPPPKNGTIEYLKYGTTIVPADLSQRIMNMALNNPIRPSMSIQNMMPQMMPTNIHNITESPVVQIHGNLSFPNIHGGNEAHELIDELCKMGNNAYQRAWRR